MSMSAMPWGNVLVSILRVMSLGFYLNRYQAGEIGKMGYVWIGMMDMNDMTGTYHYVGYDGLFVCLFV